MTERLQMLFSSLRKNWMQTEGNLFGNLKSIKMRCHGTPILSQVSIISIDQTRTNIITRRTVFCELRPKFFTVLCLGQPSQEM